MNQRQTTRKP